MSAKHDVTERFIDARSVAQIVGVSRASIYSWVKAGVFPVQRKLGRRKVGWKQSEIVQWVESREPSSAAAVSKQ